MNKLVLSPFDTVQERQGRTRLFASTMTKDVDGPDGAREIKIFIESYRASASVLGRKFSELLADDEYGFIDISGRLKYVGASLRILETCGEVAETTDGLCREVAKMCMSNIYGEIEGLKDTFEHTRIAAERTKK
ncbi:hypothetical protein K2Q08_01845 [Patescibacteria group bacterium]|nr:hypothetical protein [Patescibacteria group bacterium]